MSQDKPTELGPEFYRAYSTLLAAVWSNEDELTKLLADPTRYAIDKGMPVAEGATVQVNRTDGDALPRKEEVAAEWTATPGVHVLRVPSTAPVDISELTEAELDAVSAGDNNIYFFIL
jgi:hypothetical protein